MATRLPKRPPADQVFFGSACNITLPVSRTFQDAVSKRALYNYLPIPVRFFQEIPGIFLRCPSTRAKYESAVYAWHP